jgi:hypothetical protein
MSSDECNARLKCELRVEILESKALALGRFLSFSFPNGVWECLPRREASNVHQTRAKMSQPR